MRKIWIIFVVFLIVLGACFIGIAKLAGAAQSNPARARTCTSWQLGPIPCVISSPPVRYHGVRIPSCTYRCHHADPWAAR